MRVNQQTLYRKIHKIPGNYDEQPVLEVINIKRRTEGGITIEEKEPFSGLHRGEIIEIKNGVNVGLASQEILTLLNMYELLIHMEEVYRVDKEEYLEATILKVKVEKALREEVFSGYKKYHSLLGLEMISNSGLWNVEKDNIKYTYTITDEQKKSLSDEISSNPEKYQ